MRAQADMYRNGLVVEAYEELRTAHWHSQIGGVRLANVGDVQEVRATDAGRGT